MQASSRRLQRPVDGQGQLFGRMSARNRNAIGEDHERHALHPRACSGLTGLADEVLAHAFAESADDDLAVHPVGRADIGQDGVIACTAFEAGDDKPPFVVEFDIGVAQIDPDENAAKALERAAAKALQRQAV